MQNTLQKSSFNEKIELENFSYLIRPANSDLTAPNITFINPDTNNTIIESSEFLIIVTITDDNPPLPGNVSIEISNTSASLFNESMMLNEDDSWYFLWDNLTSYTNNQTYIFRVTAKDSSSNENYGFSDDFYIILDYYNQPSLPVINLILYIVVICVFFALIMVYINKKRGFLQSFKDDSEI